MLTPDEVEALGWGTAAQASRAEQEMLEAVERAVREAIGRGTVATAMQLQAAVYAECREIARKRGDDITEEAQREAYEALRASLAHDIDRARISHQTALRNALWASQERSQTMAWVGIYARVRHMPLDMARSAQREYERAVSRHALAVASGAEVEDVAIARAYRELADRGITSVNYQSGVSTSPDVAARRAIRTSVVQAGNAQTLDVCHAAGVSLIEVSSHVGARPSHAEWQGRIYADPGPQTVDGTTYEDFGEGTGYYGGGPYGGIADRLCGVNCRHSFAPYVSGTEPMYSPDPDAEQGWDRETVYDDTQEQRRLERNVRKAKNRADSLESLRDTDAGRLEYDAARAKVRAAQKELRDHVSSKPWLQRDYRLERSRKQMAEIARERP